MSDIRLLSILEAIDAILQCSSSANELLRRQKLKKEHLRDYLIEFGDKAKLSKIVKADKDSLIKMVLKMWSSQTVQVFPFSSNLTGNE